MKKSERFPLVPMCDLSNNGRGILKLVLLGENYVPPLCEKNILKKIDQCSATIDIDPNKETKHMKKEKNTC